MGEMKPAVMGKWQLQKPKHYFSYILFKFSHYQDSDARNKIHGFLLDHSSTIWKPSIERLMKEIEPVVTEENKFEYREKSKLLAFARNFGHSRSWCEAQDNCYRSQIFRYT